MAHNQQHQRLEQVNIHELMEKVSSKKDVYNFLAQECEAYLPKMDTINIFFLKQITRGLKEVRLLATNFSVCEAIRCQGLRSSTD
jgi:hypothetical protein